MFGTIMFSVFTAKTRIFTPNQTFPKRGLALNHAFLWPLNML